MSVILNLVDRLKLQTQLGISFLLIIFGFILNYYFFMSLFLIKMLLVLGILNILIFAIRYFDVNIEEIFIEVAGDSVINANKKNFFNNIYSNSNIIISLIVGAYFVTISILLNFVQFNFLGLFALVALLVTVFVSILGYLINIYLIKFVWSLSKANISNYSTFYPANTRWLVLTSKLVNYSQNIFFVSGSMYIILFSLFSPTNTIEILSSPHNNLNIFIPLFLSWLIIIAAIIIAFPITLIIKNLSIRNIVENMKFRSIKEFEEKITYVSPEVQLGYAGIIKEIKNSDRYPFDKRTNLVIPYVTTLINLITVLNAVSPSVKYILKKLF